MSLKNAGTRCIDDSLLLVSVNRACANEPDLAVLTNALSVKTLIPLGKLSWFCSSARMSWLLATTGSFACCKIDSTQGARVWLELNCCHSFSIPSNSTSSLFEASCRSASSAAFVDSAVCNWPCASRRFASIALTSSCCCDTF